MKKFTNFIFAISGFLLIMGTSNLYAESQCTHVPKSEQTSPVYACQTANEYLFEINGESLHYNKSIYQNELSHYIYSWLQTTNKQSDFSNAKVEIWLSMPEINPSATQMRAVVTANHLKFIVFLSIRPEEWLPQKYNIGILNKKESYPQTYGIKATSLLINQMQKTNDQEFMDILANYGIKDVKKFSTNWYQAATQPFQEQLTADKVEKSSKTAPYVKKIQTNAVVEWIALREMVFSFRLISED